MNRKSFIIFFILLQSTAGAQPSIQYTLRIDEKDLSAFHVTMAITNMPPAFRVAMFAHPEYDDHYWRYVENFHAESDAGKTIITREDSALWKISSVQGKVILYYSIRLPEHKGFRAAWRPFLSSVGGLTGGYHVFMYVVEAMSSPSQVSLELPPGWQAVTALEKTSSRFVFLASSAFTLIDGPILIGHFKDWKFDVDGVAHHLAYFSLPGSKDFDSTELVNNIKKIVEQSSLLFGGLPYREYFLLMQDSSYGALEHRNSVTIGAPADELNKNINSYLPEIAHEYFHNWNIMRIRPVEYRDMNYKPSGFSRGLWWSEGLTMFYADLLLRRAHLPTSSATRIEHLERLMSRYFSNPGNVKISPEEVSLAAYANPGALGDYSASTHLQGELIGSMIDLMIRDATNGEHSIDDVMRRMFEQFGDKKGFSGSDIEDLTANICHCEKVHGFFANYVRGNKPLDFNRYLGMIGLHSDLSWKSAVNEQDLPAADLRIFAWTDEKNNVRLGISDPSSCWGKAGLHTGDQVLSVNGKQIEHDVDFYQSIRQAKIGDTLSLEIRHTTSPKRLQVIVSGYQQAVIHIEQLKNISEKQQRLLTQWLDGK